MSRKNFEQAAGHAACLGFLRQLTSLVQESTNEPTQRVALACVDTIVETFGKKDIGAVIGATSTVIECLGAASEEMQITTDKWRSNAGSVDLYMVFKWLKDDVKVKKILEVVVEDFADGESKPHSDKAIVECLKDLQVETWDWRRMDIPSQVIVEAAGEHVKTLYLYCSGLRAVLQSWSDRGGLANLKKVNYLPFRPNLPVRKALTKMQLQKVYVEVYQVRTYAPLM